MKLGAKLLAVASAILAVALWPGIAGAKSNQGLHCGRGHAKHTRHVGQSCDKSSKHHHKGATGESGPVKTDNDGATGETGPTGPTGPKERGNSQNTAAAKCRREQSSDPAAFQAKYGKGRNAFGKCVEANTPSHSGSSTSTTP